MVISSSSPTCSVMFLTKLKPIWSINIVVTHAYHESDKNNTSNILKKKTRLNLGRRCHEGRVSPI